MKDEDGYFYIDEFGNKCRSEEEEVDLEVEKHRIKKDVICLGWIRGENLTVRPRRNQMAMLFDLNMECYWLHIPMSCYNNMEEIL